jgi:hypothetical protein
MIVCPVCEHPQAEGAECEVCGRPLRELGVSVPAVPRLPGIEPTRLDWEDDPFALPDALAELEPTATMPVDVPEVAAPDLEPTRAAPVDVEATALPDIERTAAPREDERAAPLVVVCRYCRTPALPGERICGRCGMRLPVTAGPDRSAGEGEPRRCSCGAIASGARCPSCGGRLPAEGVG